MILLIINKVVISSKRKRVLAVIKVMVMIIVENV